MKKILFIFCALWLSVTMVAQMTSCTDTVLNAIEQADNICQDIARNQICYGNQNVTAEPLLDVTDLVSRIPVILSGWNVLRRLHVAQWQEGTNIWGITLLKVQANLPNSIPGMNATILVFGDVRNDTRK